MEKSKHLEELLVNQYTFNKNSIKDLDDVLDEVIANNPDIAKRLEMIIKGMKDG